MTIDRQLAIVSCLGQATLLIMAIVQTSRSKRTTVIQVKRVFLSLALPFSVISPILLTYFIVFPGYDDFLGPLMEAALVLPLIIGPAVAAVVASKNRRSASEMMPAYPPPILGHVLAGLKWPAAVFATEFVGSWLFWIWFDATYRPTG